MGTGMGDGEGDNISFFFTKLFIKTKKILRTFYSPFSIFFEKKEKL
jgi:hypothetical protein